MSAPRTLLCSLTAASLGACFPSFPDDCFENGCEAGFVCAAGGQCVGGNADAGVTPTDGGVRVIEVDPERNAIDGDPDGVEVTFSQPMRPGSAETFLLRSEGDGRLAAGTYGGGQSATLTFTPTMPLAAGIEAEATLRTTLQSTTGAPLVEPHVFRFWTATRPSGGRFTASGSAMETLNVILALRAGDFDGDGTIEAFYAESAGIRAADVSARGVVTLRATPPAANAQVLDFDAGDIDGDGRTDLIVASFENQGTRAWFGEDGGTFRQGAVIAVGRPLKAIRLGDLDGDGDLDFAAVIRESNQAGGENVLIALGNGNGSFVISAPLSSLPAPGNAHDLRLADMDNDGQLDVVVLNDAITRGDGSVVVLENDGRGVFGNAEMDKRGVVGQTSDSMAVGDLDGDGFVDVAVGQRLDSVVSVLINNRDGGFMARRNFAVAAPDDLAMGDVDGDGDLDVVTSEGEVLVNTVGNGELEARAGGFVGGSRVALSDVDGDGDLDTITSAIVPVVIHAALNE